MTRLFSTMPAGIMPRHNFCSTSKAVMAYGPGDEDDEPADDELSSGPLGGPDGAGLFIDEPMEELQTADV